MTATAKATIDWNKPVQASYDGGKTWIKARLGVVLSGCQYCNGVVFEHEPGAETCRWCDETGKALGCGICVRNTTAPPVPFDYTKYVNVYRYSDGTEALGDMYDSLDKATASARRAVGVQVATVPVTIRGEWPGEEVQGG